MSGLSRSSIEVIIKKDVIILHPADKSASAFIRWLIDNYLI